jgi:hypothetical protein
MVIDRDVNLRIPFCLPFRLGLRYRRNQFAPKTLNIHVTASKFLKRGSWNQSIGLSI